MKGLKYIWKIVSIILLLGGLSFWLYLILFPIISRELISDNIIKNGMWSNWNSSWWTTIIISTWWTIATGDNILPTWPREYVQYILDKWKPWIDYIVVNPTIPPIIHSKNKQDNNSIMYAYVNKYSNQFTVAEHKVWYVLFTTKYWISDNRDLFIAINWVIRWHIIQNKSLPVRNQNEYLYKIDTIPVTQWEWASINLNNYINNWKLIMTAFVWEQGNYLQSITLVFK